jgi:hypothetical protein
MSGAVHPLRRSWFSACLALILAGAFGLRVAALPAGLACVAGGAGATPSHHAGPHGHDHRGPDAPTPACVCVAHAPGIGVAVEPARLTPPRPLGVLSAPDFAGDGRGPSSAVAHVLPFSIGPPALLG